MARPRIGDEKRVGAQVGARVTQGTKDALERMAAAKHRYPADEIREALENHVLAGDRKAARK